ncbi:hypothetical protein [Kitasatospora sp. NPDC004289]
MRSTTRPGGDGPATYLERWRDERRQWTLLLAGRPLAPEQVAAVADGLRE